jgi:hypothetical protein
MSTEMSELGERGTGMTTEEISDADSCEFGGGRRSVDGG